MKKAIIIAAMLLIAGVNNSSTYAQVQRQGNTFVQEKKQPAQGTKTKYTWKDSKGVEYPIYIAKSGSCYVNRVSKNTGKEYRQYLGKEISATICKELGIDYKPTNKK